MALAKYNLPPNEVLYRFWIGGEELHVTTFEIQDALSSPGYCRLSLISFNASLDLQSMLGKRAKLEICFGTSDERHKRYYHGVVQSFEIAGTDDAAAYYEVVVVPEIWTLSLKYRSRVHVTDRAQGKSVDTVVLDILQEAGLQSYATFKKARSYEAYSFLTQYNETDLDFIHRILEEDGFTYYIDHQQDHEQYIFTDDTTSLDKASPYDEVLVRRSSGAILDEYESIEQFTCKHKMSYGKVEFRNYDFKDSNRRLNDNSTGKSDQKFEYYEYGGNFQDQEGAKERMKRLSDNRAQAFDAGVVEAVGRGDYRCLTAGMIFTAKNAPSDNLNRDWLCTEILSKGTESEHADSESAAMGGGGSSYEMSFKCIPSDVPYRPARRTPKPRIVGAQTAIVVGSSGQEIYTDKFGRVKVHLHWDRQPKSDGGSPSPPNYNENSSFWCRVAQTAAGKGWGIFSLPRVGQEVMVDFIGGDPDQPMVVGCVHNSHQTPPYALPDHKTRTTIKTNSSPGGDGFNEIRFEDKKGSEQIFMHAEKNLDIRVKNDCMESIGANRHLTVGNEKDGGDQKERVYGNVHLEVFKNHEERIREDSYVRVDKNHHMFIQSDNVVTIKGEADFSVDGNSTEAHNADHYVQVGGDKHTMVFGDEKRQAGGSMVLQAMDLVVSASAKLTLVCGGSFITIDASGISLMGPMINLNSGGMPGTPTLPSVKSTADATQAEPEEPTPADNDKTGEKSMLPQPPQ